MATHRALRGRAGALALVPPVEPVGRTPLIDVGDAVPLVRTAPRSRANASASTNASAQDVVEASSDVASPSDVPSPQIREMMRRIREGTPLSALNFTAADEDWGVYLLFGDERDESGMGDGDDGGGDGGVDGGGEGGGLGLDEAPLNGSARTL